MMLKKFATFSDPVLVLSFLREPFSEDFRECIGLTDDAVYLDAVKAFMGHSKKTFRWNDYLEARTTAEQAFRAFYEQQKYPVEELDGLLEDFIISFFNQVIDECQYEWEDAHPDEEMPEAPADDVHTLLMARVFSWVPFREEDEAFCKSIGVEYHFEQLHMCTWFSSQITNGEGHYSRSEINYSARTAYNRLMNPRSLLWIGVVMGADRTALKAAAEEMAEKKTNAAKCGTVRRHVPFDALLPRFNEMMEAEEDE